MYILTKNEMQAAEARAVARGVSMKELMRLAGEALARLVLQKAEPRGKRVLVLVGSGNNGGDGFVCARMLHAQGALVTLALVQGGVKSSLAGQAFLTVPEEVPVLYTPEDAADEAAESDIIVDAVFGFGFRGVPDQRLSALFEAVNALHKPVFSADIPSGAECDTGCVHGACIRATYTAAFSALKPTHVSYPAKEHCGEVLVCPAGLLENELRLESGSFSG